MRRGIAVIVGAGAIACRSTPPPQDSVAIAEVLAAAYAANSLEDLLHAQPDRFKSVRDVYEHYRQGYSEEIAQRLVAHSWDDVRSELRAGHFALARPDTAIVLHLAGDSAVVAYVTPRYRRDEWNEDPYLIAHLRKINGRWRITSEVPTKTQPAGLPDPPA